MDPNLPAILSRFAGRRVLVVGDMMLDEYYWGTVDRISPEAPVPVVLVKEETKTLGGAGNVVNNLCSLGAEVWVAGAMGADRGGEILSGILDGLSVHSEALIRDPERPTTRKIRVLADNQQVVRIDREAKRTLSPDQVSLLSDRLAEIVPQVDVVLVSDYAKGVVTPGLLAVLFPLCQKHGKPVIVDPKVQDFAMYQGAFAVTPNLKEASLALGLSIEDEAGLLAAGESLREAADAPHVLVTRGKEGMALFSRGAAPLLIPARARQVFDVSGAGDTVLAVLGLSLAAGATMADAARLANTAAGVVVGKVGTAPILIGELEKELSDAPDPATAKFRSLESLSAAVRDLRHTGRKIVLTNGCFDLLHAGHVRLFAESKRLGDVLVVAVDDDESVRALKGEGRPVIRQDQRMRMIAAIDSVDFVTVFSAGRLEDVIRAARPDVLTKGCNYTSEQVDGQDLVRELGGRVELVPITDGLSASSIIREIREAGGCKGE